MIQWLKNNRKYILIIILICSICASVDYNLVKKRINPVFAIIPIYDVTDNRERENYRVQDGPLYYIKIETGDDSDLAIDCSSTIKIGIWFLPSITIYKSIYER